MKTKVIRSFFCAAALSLLSLCPQSALAQAGAEKIIKARQANYYLMGQQMARINATLKGDAAFDKASLQLSGEALEVLSRLVQSYYVQGSDQGETKAKPEIWKEMPRFNQLAQDSQLEVRKLKEVLQRGDLVQIKNAYASTNKSCKACHDAFKAH